MKVTCFTHCDSECVVDCIPVDFSEQKSSSNSGRRKMVTFDPDFVLVRNEVRGPLPSQDFKKVLFALMYAKIPCVNSLESIYMVPFFVTTAGRSMMLLLLFASFWKDRLFTES